jgi:hypothetical protein
MPIDPRLWTEAPIGSSYPVCMAVKAAEDQPGEPVPGEAAPAYRYLRAAREGLMCFRRKLDTTEALVEEARGAGLDAERFRRSLASHAIVEAFGGDLEEARDPPAAAREVGQVKRATVGERVTFPSTFYLDEDGGCHAVLGFRPYEEHRAAAEAAGAARRADAPPEALDALRRFGRMATAEVAAVCDLPGPRAPAELWRLAAEWQVKPVPVVTGHLWEAV